MIKKVRNTTTIISMLLVIVLSAYFLQNALFQITKPFRDFNVGIDPYIETLLEDNFAFGKNGLITDKRNGFIYSKNAVALSVSSSSDVSLSHDFNNSLIGYSTPNLSVNYYTEAKQTYFSQSILVDGIDWIDNTYYSGDMLLDTTYYPAVDADYTYTSFSKPEYIFYSDRNLKVTYNSDNLITSVAVNQIKEVDYFYNSNKNIVEEVNYKANIHTYYSYSGNKLYSKTVKDLTGNIVYSVDLSSSLSLSNGQIKRGENSFVYDNRAVVGISNGDKAVDLAYGNGNYSNRVVGKDFNGNHTEYSYLNNSLVAEINNQYAIDYILNQNKQAIGFVTGGEYYYYLFDNNGSVKYIINDRGDVVVEYVYSNLGELLEILGSLASTIGKQNSILLSGDYIYDHDLSIYYTEKGVYDPSTATGYFNESSIKEYGNFFEGKNFFEKSYLDISCLIKDKISEVIIKTLNKEDIKATKNAIITDNFNIARGVADIYSLPVDLTNLNFANLINGNQVYDVVVNTPLAIYKAEQKLELLTDAESNQNISYFNEYKPTLGTVKTEGHFIYLDKYVYYSTIDEKDGLVTYEVKDNKRANYKIIESKNIYNFDQKGYEVYNYSTYDVDSFKGVKIIPGFNQESYEILENEFNNLIDLVGQIQKHNIQYYDEDAEKEFIKNTTPDDWNNLQATNGKYLALTENGLTEKVIEFKYPSNINWAQVGKVIAVVVVVALATTAVILSAGTLGPMIAAGFSTVAFGTTMTVGAATVIANVVAAVCLASFVVTATMGFFSLQELLTGENFLLDTVFDGNKELYYSIFTVSALVSFAGIYFAVIGNQALANQGASGSSQCFIAGTQISTKEGFKSIETIKIGDYVYSFNENTKTVELKKVVNLFRNTTATLVKITTATETITTTLEHPFYVNGKWIEAKNLMRGDYLQDINGNLVIIEKIRHERVTAVPVYNFEVKDNHNYYVSRNNVLVHNSCKDPDLEKWTREDYLKNIENEELKKEANQIYRNLNPKKPHFGDGGTADAIRLAKSHSQKGIERSKNIADLINSGTLSVGDQKIAKSLLIDLFDALQGADFTLNQSNLWAKFLEDILKAL